MLGEAQRRQLLRSAVEALLLEAERLGFSPGEALDDLGRSLRERDGSVEPDGEGKRDVGR
ncbi:MAG: hypothetical protein M0Z66_14800 [Thermaerobacter sp.]|nr:hypothetical protein [Thermaerobacter sp.]